MEHLEFICLANSRKYGGRCVAGLRLDGGGWVRPIGSAEGTLYAYHYRLPDGSEARVLDVLRVPVVRPLPRPYQKENWRVADDAPWELLHRPAPPTAAVTLLRAAIVRAPEVFGCCDRRVHRSHATGESLALVYPQNIRWRISHGRRKQRQTRAVFFLRGVEYDLSITDPLWEERLKDLPDGEHPKEAAEIAADERLLFVLSLGEPFEDDFCYKLVATVLPIPAEYRAAS